MRRLRNMQHGLQNSFLNMTTLIKTTFRMFSEKKSAMYLFMYWKMPVYINALQKAEMHLWDSLINYKRLFTEHKKDGFYITEKQICYYKTKWHYLTKSSKSTASIAKSNKQWVGTCKVIQISNVWECTENVPHIWQRGVFAKFCK